MKQHFNQSLTLFYIIFQYLIIYFLIIVNYNYQK
jgi:hypothetical protein